LSKSAAKKVLERFAWSQPICPVVQQYGQGSSGGGLYVEYILVGYGPDYSGGRLTLGRALTSDMLLAFPSPAYRLPACADPNCAAIGKLDDFLAACATDTTKTKVKKPDSMDKLLAGLKQGNDEKSDESGDQSQDESDPGCLVLISSGCVRGLRTAGCNVASEWDRRVSIFPQWTGKQIGWSLHVRFHFHRWQR